MPACMSEDGNQAVFIGTNLMTGDAAALCQDCLPAFLVSLLAGMTETDPDRITTALYGTDDVPAFGAGVSGDEPPPPQPADTDNDAEVSDVEEGEAASWVENGNPPPSNHGVRGRTRPEPSSAEVPTGGSSDDD